MDGPSSALEQFRQQWREEVSARSRTERKRQFEESTGRPRATLENSRTARNGQKPPAHHSASELKDEDAAEGAEDGSSSLIERIEGLSLPSVDEDDFSAKGSSKEPHSALEHYERAVEKESQGSLGDSLSHYRRAYRLDAYVDQSYKSKHFPTKSKPLDSNPSNAPVTVPSTAHHSSKEPNSAISTHELIASFAELPIVGAPPTIEGDRPPPCPISQIPSEVLLEVLLQTAVLDPASFARLSLVCKKLAFHVYMENQIWKRVALGSEFGLGSQRYNFSTDLQGREAIDRIVDSVEDQHNVDESHFHSSKHQDWREIFHSYPRIRFTGVYISTVNYTRPGGASTSQATWSSPIHIVTYYRYLRFFRDGTVISLLTTNEPIEVVHHLTKENMESIRATGKEHHPLNFTSSAPALSGVPAQSVPPTAQGLLKHMLRGRWRLCHPSLGDDGSLSDIATGASDEGDLHIETEGAGPRYMYTMHLSLKSSSRSKHSVKNNKLQWKGFWSYNHLTNDWAEFRLKNDKAFLFSRVRSYGLGY